MFGMLRTIRELTNRECGLPGDYRRFPHFLAEARQQLPDRSCYDLPTTPGYRGSGGGGPQGGFGWIVVMVALLGMAVALLWIVLF
jgi:hypothetical protein